MLKGTLCRTPQSCLCPRVLLDCRSGHVSTGKTRRGTKPVSRHHDRNRCGAFIGGDFQGAQNRFRVSHFAIHPLEIAHINGGGFLHDALVSQSTRHVVPI